MGGAASCGRHWQLRRAGPGGRQMLPTDSRSQPVNGAPRDAAVEGGCKGSVLSATPRRQRPGHELTARRASQTLSALSSRGRSSVVSSHPRRPVEAPLLANGPGAARRRRRGSGGLLAFDALLWRSYGALHSKQRLEDASCSAVASLCLIAQSSLGPWAEYVCSSQATPPGGRGGGGGVSARRLPFVGDGFLRAPFAPLGR